MQNYFQTVITVTLIAHETATAAGPAVSTIQLPQARQTQCSMTKSIPIAPTNLEASSVHNRHRHSRRISSTLPTAAGHCRAKQTLFRAADYRQGGQGWRAGRSSKMRTCPGKFPSKGLKQRVFLTTSLATTPSPIILLHTPRRSVIGGQ